MNGKYHDLPKSKLNKNDCSLLDKTVNLHVQAIHSLFLNNFNPVGLQFDRFEPV